MMSFSEAVRTCLHKYADFDGRATRAEYWWFSLFTALLAIVCCIPVGVGAAMLAGDSSSIAAWVVTILGCLLVCAVAFGLLIPSLAVTVRRLHDTNKAGWWYFICFVPYVGSFIMLVFMILASGPDNQYGSDPHAPAAPAPAPEAPAETPKE